MNPERPIWLGDYFWEESTSDGSPPKSTPLPAEVVSMFRPQQCLLCGVSTANNLSAYTHYETLIHFRTVAQHMREKFNAFGSLKANKNVFEPIRCDKCLVELTSRIAYLQHIDSKLHAKNAASDDSNFDVSLDFLKDLPPPIPKTTEFVCSLCNVTTTTRAQMVSHNEGSRHLKNLSKLADGELRDYFVKEGNCEAIPVGVIPNEKAPLPPIPTSFTSSSAAQLTQYPPPQLPFGQFRQYGGPPQYSYNAWGPPPFHPDYQQFNRGPPPYNPYSPYANLPDTTVPPPNMRFPSRFIEQYRVEETPKQETTETAKLNDDSETSTVDNLAVQESETKPTTPEKPKEISTSESPQVEEAAPQPAALVPSATSDVKRASTVEFKISGKPALSKPKLSSFLRRAAEKKTRVADEKKKLKELKPESNGPQLCEDRLQTEEVKHTTMATDSSGKVEIGDGSGSPDVAEKACTDDLEGLKIELPHSNGQQEPTVQVQTIVSDEVAAQKVVQKSETKVIVKPSKKRSTRVRVGSSSSPSPDKSRSRSRSKKRRKRRLSSESDEPKQRVEEYYHRQDQYQNYWPHQNNYNYRGWRGGRGRQRGFHRRNWEGPHYAVHHERYYGGPSESSYWTGERQNRPPKSESRSSSETRSPKKRKPSSTECAQSSKKSAQTDQNCVALPELVPNTSTTGPEQVDPVEDRLCGSRSVDEDLEVEREKIEILKKVALIRKKVLESQHRQHSSKHSKKSRKKKSKKKKSTKKRSSSSSSSSSSTSSSSASSTHSIADKLMETLIALTANSKASSSPTPKSSEKKKKSSKKSKKRKSKRKRKKSPSQSYYCNFCDLTSPTADLFVEHIVSDSHKLMCRLLKK